MYQGRRPIVSQPVTRAHVAPSSRERNIWAGEETERPHEVPLLSTAKVAKDGFVTTVVATGVAARPVPAGSNRRTIVASPIARRSHAPEGDSRSRLSIRGVNDLEAP